MTLTATDRPTAHDAGLRVELRDRNGSLVDVLTVEQARSLSEELRGYAANVNIRTEMITSERGGTR